MINGVKKPITVYHRQMKRRVGETRCERGSVMDFSELDELWTDRSHRLKGRLKQQRTNRGSDKSSLPGVSPFSTLIRLYITLF